MQRRRHTDPAQSHRRREDVLEELLEHGSRNFRRYRRKATVWFIILSLGTAYAIKGNSDQIERNRLAIRVSCTLLANAIVESGAASSSGPQRDLTAFYVGIIRRNMTPAERRREVLLVRSLGRSQGLVTVPPCKRIIAHPGSVRAVPVPTPG